ncbi:uncharacterized protein LOC123540079 [Mercenaria mercenaria]|uniref:uncharacterized protein LOC123540079 n=1 Tax=Mercenaria mercenaria TaxID=6596 RepID=UPI00234FA934|nr:uncharacterized protein LOC123540079 [Mercenaria mercenaria]
MKFSDITMELSPVQLAQRYDRLRNEDVYKDVTLTSHSNAVSAHKCVLSIGSQFFKLLFQQAQRKKDMFHRSSFELVGLTAEDARHLEAVIDFLYSGVIYMNDVNFTAIMKLADYLAIEELLDLGEKYLEQGIAKENCLKVYLDMKKTLNGEASKGTSSTGKMDELLKVVWAAVETNFYEHIIDHHEFLEVMPEEIEELLIKDFLLQKVLNLAVRWMKTWPLGFTFAESLVNISYNKLSTALENELTDKCIGDIVRSVKVIKEQVASRTVPKSNRENMLKKLKEIQKAFDENYVESDIDEEAEIGKDSGETNADVMETDVETESKDAVGDNEYKNEKLKNENQSKDINNQGVTLPESDEAKSEIQSNENRGNVNEKTKGLDENLAKAENECKINDQHCEKQHKNVKGKTKGNIIDIEQEGTNVCSQECNEKSKKDMNGTDIHVGKDKNEEDNVEPNDNREGCLGDEKNSSEKSGLDKAKNENLAAESKGVPESAENLEQRPEDKVIDIPESIRLIDRKKIDGTEEEIPDSVDDEDVKSPKMDTMYEDQVTDSNSHDETESGAVTLHDRVAECLKLQRVVKKEDEDGGSHMTKIKPTKGKRGRGRPKKYIGAVQEEESKMKVATVSRNSKRGLKRKATDSEVGISGSEVDETVVKVEVDGDDEDEDTDTKVIETKEEMADGTEPDWDKDTKSEGEDDSNDEYTEDVFAEALKKVSGIDMMNSGRRKKARKRAPRKPGHHECEVCQKVYTQKYRLTQHMNMHLGIKPYKCVVCMQCFSRTDHVVRHMRSQHSEYDMYKCDQCDEEFEKANEMVTHSVIHIPQNDDAESSRVVTVFTDAEKEYISISSQESGKPQYSCRKCNQTFRRPYQAREHINFHTGEKPFKCSICDAAYAKRENLAAHVRSVHQGKKGEHKCPKCRRTFLKKENYDAHFEKCEPNYACQQCPLKFYRKTHLDNHTPVHDLTPQHKCPHCENAYRYRKHMLRHVRKDHLNQGESDIPCICDICGVVVKNKEALYRHKKVHKTPDKECDVCGKAFKDNTTLKDHKVMHTNIRDYQCEICSMLFARKGNLIRHQKRHRGERKYRCEMCGMCFVANCDLTRHKNTHLGVKKFPCRYCGRKFGLKSKVVVHERTHTGERPYVCRDEGCGKTFKQTGDRVRHEKKVHSLTYNKYMTLYELATGESEDIFKGSDGMTLPYKVMTLPVNAGFETTAANSSTSQETEIDASVQTEGPGAGSFATNSNLNNSFIEEAEMSKIFQRTVAAISQEAIANSGIYN